MSGKTTNDRILWLTDTFGDKNGVSTVLNTIHQEIRFRNLPIDILVCSNTLQPEEHLIVIRPLTEFTFPLYRNQTIRIPVFLSIQRIFRRGKYTRIICSTEGPMGIAALWLKKTFSVEASFFLHTDWLIFAQAFLSLEETGMGRIQKILKAYYQGFNNVFVLNTDQQKWLTGAEMGFDPSRVFLTAHWADRIFTDPLTTCPVISPFNINAPAILYAGRLSKEKGVSDIRAIFSMVRLIIPEMQIIVAGTGPCEEELKQSIPDALFLGWVNHEAMPSLFHSADIMLLPSRFDTFSCVTLEALSCGLPVAAYNTKGPKDIIQDSVNGFLAETPEELAGKIIGYFLFPDLRLKMKKAARLRAEDYHAEPIMDKLLHDIGLFKETLSV
ncbi:MAG: glycosyltransferase [Bacteroidales bacterium]|nr:glycosyltransferase [Bacteroidales bacterium]